MFLMNLHRSMVRYTKVSDSYADIAPREWTRRFFLPDATGNWEGVFSLMYVAWGGGWRGYICALDVIGQGAVILGVNWNMRWGIVQPFALDPGPRAVTGFPSGWKSELLSSVSCRAFRTDGGDSGALRMRVIYDKFYALSSGNTSTCDWTPSAYLTQLCTPRLINFRKSARVVAMRRRVVELNYSDGVYRVSMFKHAFKCVPKLSVDEVDLPQIGRAHV